MKITDLNPQLVWKNFHSLTQIPRPSKHEEKVSEFLYNYGKSLGLETIRDEVGNIIIRKEATPGYENRMGVILQGHMDMVPQKNSDVEHDFEKDPIVTRIDGEWVKATGTTLGADNGIGVALGMSVLESKDLEHGPVELLVTIDEETGMTGANALSSKLLKGDLLINCDSEAEGELCVGCAGGLDTNVSASYKCIRATKGLVLYRLLVKGLRGGHSGMDISLYRANANRAAARIVLPLIEKYGVKIADFKGGSLRNAIPFEAEVTMLVNPETLASVKADIDKAFGEIKAEFAETDPSAVCLFEALEVPVTEYIEDGVALRAVKSVLACPNGVERMSASVEGLTETSNNLAVIRTENGHLVIRCLMRSSVDSAKEALALRMRSVFELAGAEFTTCGGYSGWTPKPDTPIIATVKEVYRKLYGQEMKVMAIHAGLECALLGAKYPNWDMVSFGPTIVHPHSPDERVKIDTVGRTWELVKALLENIPEK